MELEMEADAGLCACGWHTQVVVHTTAFSWLDTHGARRSFDIAPTVHYTGPL